MSMFWVIASSKIPTTTENGVYFVQYFFYRKTLGGNLSIMFGRVR
jgi:hypothetical protein